jgi:hypothetical protein
VKKLGERLMTNLKNILSSENFRQSTSLESYTGFSGCDNSGPIVDGAVPTWIAEGDTGYGRWGYIYTNSELGSCVAGDHVWWRLYVKYDADFIFDSEVGSMKHFRIGRVVQETSANRGYVDMYLENGGGHATKGIVEFEDPPLPGEGGEGSNGAWNKYHGSELNPSAWTCFEVYCYLHPVDGIMRLWKDGVLTGSFTRPTIADPTSDAESRVSRLLYMTYYNGGAPATQGLQFSHHAVAIKNAVRDDTQWLSTDEQGNKFIGTGTEEGSELPIEPPVIPPVDPVEPPPVPIPGPGVTMHVDKHAVHINTDLPVVVTGSDGREKRL